jgi:Ca2+-binding EF-hand superfamily protein
MAFMRYYRALPEGETTVEEFRAWLSQFDADGDGRISREELERALRSLNKLEKQRWCNQLVCTYK